MPSDEEPTLDITCVGSKIVNLVDDKPVTILAKDLVNGDTSGLSFNPPSYQFDCSDIGTQTISINATDDDTGAKDSCNLAITVVDTAKPTIDCSKEDVNVSLQEGDTYTVLDYRNEIDFDDNCDTDLSYSQTPAANTEIDQTKTVTITVTDDAGLKAECSFDIIVEKTEAFAIQCVKNYTAELGYNSNTAQVPTKDLIVGDTAGIEFDIETQQFYCDDIGAKTIEINATNTATGEKASCTLNVNVVDTGKPLIVCPAGVQERQIPTNGIFVLPQVVSLSGIADNCSPDEDLIIEQNPPQGTEYTEAGDYEITITATDLYDNKETCNVTYRLSQSPEKSFDCPSAEDFEPIALNQDCDYEVPDYSGSIENVQNIEDLDVQQNSIKNDASVTVTLEVYDGDDFVGDCVFDVPVEDSTDPNILNCSDLGEEVMINVGNTYHLDDYRDLLEVEDCSDYEVTQQPEQGMSISGTSDVTLTVTDDSGNISTCTFTVKVTVVEENVLRVNCPGNYNIFADENCNYRVPNFSEIVETTIENASITQSQEAGSIFDNNSDPYIRVTATFEDQSDFCDIYLMPQDDTAPVIQCPADEMIPVSNGETYTIPDYTEMVTTSDNCGEVTVTQQPVSGTVIQEDETVVLTATDTAGNTTKCEVRINLVADGEIAISCPEDKVEAFNEDCFFVLPDYTSEAALMNGDGLTVIQDPLPGTEILTSEVEVTLSIQDDPENQCSFTVFLEDRTAPVLQLKDIQVDLSEEGTASIDFEDIDNGSYDNCDPDFTYRLNKSVFSCKNMGMNTIEVTAEDSNGNISSTRVTITVLDPNGLCGEVEQSAYIFIYPNPNTGSFKVATPAGEKIRRMEVFDHRGRFITARDYDETVSEYAMELGPLQEAVYVVKIETNERTLVKRMIFKY